MGKNSNILWDVIIIGAGAAGMMAAITAAKNNKKVLIIEKLDKAGKKLLATGNGKCNFTNANMNVECFHGDSTFIKHVLDSFNVSDCLDFFHSIGIYPKEKNGYYYPNSEQASSVANALINQINRQNISVYYDTSISDIIPNKTSVKVMTNNGNYECKKLVIATGLLAAPKLGSDGSLFNQIKSLGHHFMPILPALCGYYCKGIDFKKISGVRAHGTVTAVINGQELAQDTGELQFTDYGVSGIPVFQISSFLSKGLYEKKDVLLKINLLPDFTTEQIIEELCYRKKIYEKESVLKLLNGLINQKLIDLIMNQLPFAKDKTVATLNDNDFCKLISALCELEVSVVKYRDFEFAQVCSGGIPVSDIDIYTLESKLVKNVFFAGEIIDVDGICGGYNLHFAWATGYIAGNAVSQ